jgi:branched-chain amino acid transport system ATP-binding protein
MPISSDSAPGERERHPAVLRLTGVAAGYGGAAIVSCVSISVGPGEVVSVIGPNGAGKSTFINLVTGHLPVQAGRIEFRGRDVTRLPVHRRVRLGIGRSFQLVNVFPALTALENVMIPLLALGGRAGRLLGSLRAEAPARRDAEAVLERVGLSAERDRRASALSHGDKHLLEVAVALAAKPALLFLDEPTAGMNPRERARLLESIRKLARDGGTTFALVEHDMDVVFSLSDRVVVLHFGEVLCDGSPDEVRNDTRVKEVYLGEHVVELLPRPGGAGPVARDGRAGPA